MSDKEQEKAIDLLDNLIGMVEDNHGNDYDLALKMAIKALKQESILDKSRIYDDGEPLCSHEVTEEEMNVIEIPENATNGDMLKAMFPNDLWLHIHARRAKKDWWNAPYKKGGEE